MTTRIEHALQLVRSHFQRGTVPLLTVEPREYPEEVIFVARVGQQDIERARELTAEIDAELAGRGISGFVTVRGIESNPSQASGGKLKLGLAEPRVTHFTNLLTARSRTSEVQPSLEYIPDAADNISGATSNRHHLVFGRRGAGKTALLVEAKRLVEADGHLAVWTNIQTFRAESAARSFLRIVQAICERIQSNLQAQSSTPHALLRATQLREKVERILGGDVRQIAAEKIIPDARTLVRRATESGGRRLYVFLDDFHYLELQQQPQLLDMIHGAVRDCDAWLKVAAIKHLSRWFQTSPPLGLQTGHDADHIDLDITPEGSPGLFLAVCM